MKDLKATYNKDGKMVRNGVVTRRTRAAYQHGRRLIVSLEPGDLLTMREERRQTVYTENLGWVFMQLARSHAARQAEIARQNREAKRKGLA